MHLNAYLNFTGQCREAFEFYREVLGGTLDPMETYGESEICGDMPPGMEDHVVHARLTVGDAVIMGSDVPSTHYQKPTGIWVTLAVDEPAEAERIFASLADDGDVTMDMQETHWARRFGMVTDCFHTPWMVNCLKSAEEMA